MADILTIENLGNLLMLCFLQAVLGFDNLLYISIESQRAPVASQKAVRFWGIIIAVALRIVPIGPIQLAPQGYRPLAQSRARTNRHIHTSDPCLLVCHTVLTPCVLILVQPVDTM